MTTVLAISGSPSARSRTAALTTHLAHRLTGAGFRSEHLRVRDLPAAELLAGRTDNPALREALDAVAAAQGILVATPVYKAAYSGLLKAFLDLLPQSGLVGKVVLPLMTGGSLAHALAPDYALRPVLMSLGAQHIVRGAFVLDRSITSTDDTPLHLSPDTAPRIDRTLEDFVTALAPKELSVPGLLAPEPRVHAGRPGNLLPP
jgi:FMN reductase